MTRVTEGAIPWDTAWNMDYEDFKWVYGKCVEVNEEMEKLANGNQ